ncbi:Protein SERAC1 [Trichinella papuae]|uniref:Protein SERAC1 n=1 Tax=Trichinella papuae TaxID=268474 RepID=A0A0V1N1I7_9BILA|nr:Protein SERAC1 [Trichinella papuae]
MTVMNICKFSSLIAVITGFYKSIEEQLKDKFNWREGFIEKLNIPRVSADPKCLLLLAHSSDKKTAIYGVHQLTKLHFPDWLLLSLLQQCDCSILSALILLHSPIANLIRTPPPCNIIPEGELHSKIREYLASLSKHGGDVCTTFYTELALHMKHFQSSSEDELLAGIVDAEYKLGDKLPHLRKFTMYLEALAAHSADVTTCKEMSHPDLLGLLWSCWHCTQYSSDVQIKSLVLKTLANLAAFNSSIGDALIRAGWSKILNECKKDRRRLQLQLLATKTLENLARRFPDSPTYEDGIYLLKGSFWDRDQYDADIIFVHGLRGGMFRTWRQKDYTKEKDLILNEIKMNAPQVYCWPRDWLAEDIGKSVRILGIDYASYVSDWSSRCPEFYDKNLLLSRSENFAVKLRKAGVGDRPIIWITHSMGGLLVKELLRSIDKEQCSETQSATKSILSNTVGCVFYATPHLGSSLATTSQSRMLRLFLLPSTEINLLQENSPYLVELHSDFLNILQKQQIACLSFSETLPTRLPFTAFKVLLVSENSSQAMPGSKYRLLESHFNVCKPQDRHAISYRALVDFISAII